MITYQSESHTVNIIVWIDGTIRPWKGHQDCDGAWNYDGQVYAFSCSCGERIER